MADYLWLAKRKTQNAKLAAYCVLRLMMLCIISP